MLLFVLRFKIFVIFLTDIYRMPMWRLFEIYGDTEMCLCKFFLNFFFFLATFEKFNLINLLNDIFTVGNNTIIVNLVICFEEMKKTKVNLFLVQCTINPRKEKSKGRRLIKENQLIRIDKLTISWLASGIYEERSGQ